MPRFILVNWWCWWATRGHEDKQKYRGRRRSHPLTVFVKWFVKWRIMQPVLWFWSSHHNVLVACFCLNKDVSMFGFAVTFVVIHALLHWFVTFSVRTVNVCSTVARMGQIKGQSIPPSASCKTTAVIYYKSIRHLPIRDPVRFPTFHIPDSVSKLNLIMFDHFKYSLVRQKSHRKHRP